MMNAAPTNACLDYFLYFLPPYIKDVVLVEINKQVLRKELLLREFIQYMGLWFLVSRISNGYPRRASWEDSEPSKWTGAPFQFHKYMCYMQFKNITKVLCHMNTPALM